MRVVLFTPPWAMGVDPPVGGGDPWKGRDGNGVKIVLSFVQSKREEWSPIKQRRLFPLPRVLLKLPPEPLPFHPCHPIHPLNAAQGTVWVRLPEIHLCLRVFFSLLTE